MKILDSGVVYKNEEPNMRYFQARQPAVRALSASEYLCIYNHGTAMESVDNTLAQVRTTDGGKTWRHEGFILESLHVPKQPVYSYFAPHLGKMKNGDLCLLSVRFRRENPELRVYNPQTGGCLPCDTTYFLSSDNGQTWRGPHIIPLPKGVVGYGCGPILETHDNRWMVSFETWKAFADPAPIKTRNFVLFSDDHGKTWNDEQVIVEDLTAAKVYWDTIFNIHRDGAILGLMWTHDLKAAKDLPLHRTFSADNGKTWFGPEPTNLEGQINVTMELPDGRLFVIYNRRNCERPGVYTALSKDKGKTWDIANGMQIWDALGSANFGTNLGQTFLENLATFAFGRPDAHLINESEMIIVFWATQNMITHVRWCKLALS